MHMFFVDPATKDIIGLKSRNPDRRGQDFIDCSADKLLNVGYGNVTIVTRKYDIYNSVSDAEAAGLWAMGAHFPGKSFHVGQGYIVLDSADDVTYNTLDHIRKSVTWIDDISPEERKDLKDQIVRAKAE